MDADMLSQTPSFSADFFRSNRRRLCQLFGGQAPIVITASGLLQKSADEAFLFRQDSNFWYLTGIDEPDVVLVIDKDREYLIVPERSRNQVIFHGEADYDSMSRVSGVQKVLGQKEGWARLGRRIKKVKHVATADAPQPYMTNTLNPLYANPARRHLIDRLATYNPALEILDLRPELSKLRMVKSEEEVAAIQYAIDHTAKLLKSIGKKLPKYTNECEIEADISRYLILNQLRCGFEPVIAGGASTTVLHYTANKAPLQSKEFLLIDIGPAHGYYSADITRTICLDPSKRARAVYKAVLDVQKYALSLIKPGTLHREYEKQVRQFMGEKLRELGLIKTIDNDAVAKYFPTLTSHFLGLDVHDVADYEAPFAPGMVLTVEPGIYIPEEGMGVRIEDDVLVTADGCKILSAGLGKQIDSFTIGSRK